MHASILATLIYSYKRYLLFVLKSIICIRVETKSEILDCILYVTYGKIQITTWPAESLYYLLDVYTVLGHIE